MKILKSKTFWAALGLAIIGGIESSGINVPDGVSQILAGLAVIFLRMSNAKIEETAKK